MSQKPENPWDIPHHIIQADRIGRNILRDYFAAAAVQGLIAQSGGNAIGSSPDVGASWAYEIADAMLAAREVKQ